MADNMMGPDMNRVREAVHGWLKHDAPLAVKMAMKPENVEKLCQRMEQVLQEH